MLPMLPPSQHLQAVATAAERIANGEKLDDIAKDLGVSKQSVSLWLLDECPEQYRDAQRRGLIRRIVDADDSLDRASDPLDLARARERARFARWDAERRLPKLFAQRQVVDVQVTVGVEAGVLESFDTLLNSYTKPTQAIGNDVTDVVQEQQTDPSDPE
jgi:transcriptional regulator with XRE-family HTH domain